MAPPLRPQGQGQSENPGGQPAAVPQPAGTDATVGVAGAGASLNPPAAATAPAGPLNFSFSAVGVGGSSVGLGPKASTQNGSAA